MSNNSLIVPVKVALGSLQFASVSSDSTVQDVIDCLVALDEVTSELLGDLEEAGWAIQRIKQEESGRQWEEEELNAMGDGKQYFFTGFHDAYLHRYRHCLAICPR